MREFHPLLVYLAVSSTPILCRPPQSPVDAFRLRLRTRGPSPRSCMYALLSSSSTGHRTSSPLSSQIQDEMPYIHCTCATRHGPFQPQLNSAASAETRASALFRHVRRASDAFRRAASMHHRPRHDRSADTHHDLCPHHHRGGPFSSHLHDGINGRSQRTLARSATCGKAAVASALDWTIYRLMHPGQWGPPPQSTPGSKSLHSPDAPVRWVRLREEVTTGKPPRHGLPFPDQGDHRGRSGKNSTAAFCRSLPPSHGQVCRSHEYAKLATRS